MEVDPKYPLSVRLSMMAEMKLREGATQEGHELSATAYEVSLKEAEARYDAAHALELEHEREQQKRRAR